MSLRNIAELPRIQRSEQVNQVNTEKKHQKQKLVAEITLLVMSLLVFFVGLGLISGGIPSITLLVVVGAVLVVGGLLGIVIASLLIKLAKRKEKLLLLREHELLEQPQSPSPKSFVINTLVNQLMEKEQELKKIEKTFQEIVDKYQKCSEYFTKHATRIADLEKEKAALEQRLREVNEQAAV